MYCRRIVRNVRHKVNTWTMNPSNVGIMKELPPARSISQARCLLLLGDSVTTDHISPAGSIARNSPAARYLADRGLTPREFNSYGSRRGNDAVMCRGTFANIRLVNRLAAPGPRTRHLPSGDVMDIYDAAQRYAQENVPLIAIVGKDYGSGSSRDWAAKGPYLLVDTGKSFQVKVRFDTEVDLTYFRNGGILNYMIRKML